MNADDIENEIDAIINLCSKRHRNIVEVFDLYELRDSPYHAIDMEYCPFTLADFIKGEQEVETAWNNKLKWYVDAQGPVRKWLSMSHILLDILQGLHFIHECKYVHRDLKPSNGPVPTIDILTI